MSEDAPTIPCPSCGEPVSPAPTPIQQCPHCGEQFFVEGDPDESDEDQEAREMIEQRIMRDRERLDDRHIKVIQLEKRGLYRSRTWMLVIAGLLVGVAGQLVWLGVRQWAGTDATGDAPAQAPDPQRGAAYFVIAAGLVVFSVRFFRRARRYLQEARAMTLPEPTTPPDFSTLSDGSQIVDNLRSMGRADDDAER
jgi:hypothetical protein